MCASEKYIKIHTVVLEGLRHAKEPTTNERLLQAIMDLCKFTYVYNIRGLKFEIDRELLQKLRRAVHDSNMDHVLTILRFHYGQDEFRLRYREVIVGSFCKFDSDILSDRAWLLTLPKEFLADIMVHTEKVRRAKEDRQTASRRVQDGEEPREKRKRVEADGDD